MVYQVNYIVLRGDIRTLLVAFTNADDKDAAIGKVTAAVQSPDVFAEVDSVSQLDATIIV